MRLEWSRNQLWILLITSVVVILLGYLLFKIMVAPKQEEVEELKQQIQSEQKQLNTLEEQEDNQQAISLATSRELQSELPVLQVPDQMLLAIERAEGASDSLIQSIVTGEDLGINDSADDAEISSEEQGSGTVMPAGAAAVTYDLQVASRSFEDLLSFLRKLSNLPRVVSIDSISFEDENSDETGVDALNYFVTLSAYYYPGLSELEDELPRYHFNTESNKLNPLPYGNGETDLNREDSEIE